MKPSQEFLQLAKQDALAVVKSIQDGEQVELSLDELCSLADLVEKIGLHVNAAINIKIDSQPLE